MQPVTPGSAAVYHSIIADVLIITTTTKQLVMCYKLWPMTHSLDQRNTSAVSGRELLYVRHSHVIMQQKQSGVLFIRQRTHFVSFTKQLAKYRFCLNYLLAMLAKQV